MENVKTLLKIARILCDEKIKNKCCNCPAYSLCDCSVWEEAETEMRELGEEINLTIITEEKVKKLFKCNEDGVTEWCIAKDKKQAHEFMRELWGESTMKEYEDEYLKDDPGNTLDGFIDVFFTEEDPEREFTIIDAGENGEEVTKKVSEWVEAVEEIPSYLCHENY